MGSNFYCLSDQEYKDILDGLESNCVLLSGNSGGWSMYFDLLFENEIHAHVVREEGDEVSFWILYGNRNDDIKGQRTFSSAVAANAFLRRLQSKRNWFQSIF
jgi:hypothetical protein